MSTRCKGRTHLFPHEPLNPGGKGGTSSRVRGAKGEHTKRGTTAVLAASALHALVVLTLLVTPLRRRTPQGVTQAAPLDVSLEDETPRADDEVAAEAAPSLTRTATAPSALAVRSHHRDPLPPAEPAPLAPPSSPSSSPVTIAIPSTPSIGLALGAPNRFVSRSAAEQPASTGPPDDRHVRTLAEAKRAVETALREPARQRERELGLGPEGPVLQALGEATSASSAPVKGRAVFRAVADGTGRIARIEVVECDGGRPGWADAAELARRALQGKKLRMPSSATLAEMRIEVSSDWKMPSGHDPGTDVSILGIPVAKGEGKKSTRVELLDPIPKIEMVELAPDVKVPIPQINLKIVAVQGDPADIGAKPRRVVHTKLLDSKVL